MGADDLFTISVTSAEHGARTVHLCGELDLLMWQQTVDVLQRAVESTSRRLIINLSGLTFIDATGVGALVTGLAAAREAEVEVRLIGARGLVATVLELCGLIDIEPLPEGLPADAPLPSGEA